MVNKKSVFILFSFLLILSCSSAQRPELTETENLDAKKFLSYINEINKFSPESISSTFTADGNTKEKKFRVDGELAFDKKGYYKVTIFDYVFKSPVIEAYRDLDRLYFYYPAEKKILSDDINKIDLSMYTGFKTDYKCLYTLLTGGIPLLEKFSVYKCLYDGTEKGYNLILENPEYFENIFFRDNIPEKILIIHKLSRNKAEIYLKSIVRKDKSIFFKNCRIVIPEINSSVNINFSKPVLNSAVVVDKLNVGKLKGKIETIKVN